MQDAETWMNALLLSFVNPAHQFSHSNFIILRGILCILCNFKIDALPALEQTAMKWNKEKKKNETTNEMMKNPQIQIHNFNMQKM